MQQQHAPAGLGYTVTANKLGTLGESAPGKDGLWLMDMFTGRAQLVLSLHQLAKLESDSIAMTDTLQAGSPSQSCYHWLSNPQVDASRMLASHAFCGKQGHPTKGGVAFAACTQQVANMLACC